MVGETTGGASVCAGGAFPLCGPGGGGPFLLMTGDGSGLLFRGVVTVDEEASGRLIRGAGADFDIMFSVLDLTE